MDARIYSGYVSCPEQVQASGYELKSNGTPYSIMSTVKPNSILPRSQKLQKKGWVSLHIF